ncbi:uncharacterized protein LOC125029063 [Penaeus chinensis]|uniref:uncharacterized protein LOC125029063 n=1 Tax=Penaeus chinensis TaxID=139456 RepID=UPI001FB733F4|nr:uncharacterized protein LOC125029063 [Penaeus chinensis]
MHDFVDGDVKVKLMGEKELLVEAQSAGSSHTFTRNFSLPESIDITSITSVMSSDGILTITASKKERETQQKTTVIPTSVKETHNASEVHSSTSSTTSGVSEETASGQGISHTDQEEERKYTRCYQKNIDENKTQTATSNISSNTQQSLQKESSVITDFASTRIPNSLEAKKTLGNSQDNFLPIARRGSFFQDSFFSDIRQGFDASVREILKKCNDSDLTVTDDVSHSDILSRYRQLRSRNMREEDQAFSVSSDEATIKIVLDVHDFMYGDVKVKVVDEKELVVEGRVEKKEEGSSSVSSYSFRRRFTLPHRTDMAHITPVMSSDGILTITALKMAREPQQNTHVNFSMTEEKKESTTVQDLTPEALSSVTEKNISVHENLVSVDQKDFECERKHMYTDKTRKLKKEFEVPAEKVLKPKICQNQSVDESTTGSVHEHGNVANNQDHELKRLAGSSESTITESASCDDFISAHEEQQASVQSESESTEAIKQILPITRRGSFVQDSFFLDVHQEFYTAIREVLKKWVNVDSEDFLSLSHSDILDRYRQLRLHDLREETQVSVVTSDNTSYKIVLDVQDFMNRDLKVKVVGETKVVVEGRVAKRGGSSSVSSCSFRRCFSLPEHIDMTSIICIMSSDGILTIIASEMPEELEECKVKSSAEEVHGSSEVQCSVFPTSETISLQEECHDSNFDIVEGQNQSKETIGTQESSAEVMANDSPAVSDEMQFYSLCRRNSIAMKETFDDSCASCDFGSSSQDSLLSVIPEEERDSETIEDCQQAIEILDLKDSQESINILDARDSEGTFVILDLTDSQESVDIFDVNDSQETFDILEVKGTEVDKIPDLKDSQESVDIFYQRDLETAAEVFDLKDSEAVEILDVKDSQEAVAETQNTSEGNIGLNNAKNSIKTEAKCNITKEFFDSRSPSLSAEKCVLEPKTENQDGLNKNVTLQSEDFTSGTDMSKLASNFEDNNRLKRFGQECDRESQEANSYNVTDTCIGTSSRFTSVSQSNSVVKSFPVTKRGPFFSYYFFRDTREDFQKAVREVLSKWGEKSSDDDEMTCYRKLRARNMREDNQAVTSSEDKHHYKFVIDVQDFMDVGEISVKAVNERELVVEGHLEKKEDCSESSKRFLRRFIVPGDIELEAVISVMSSDGVLKVLAPKREVYTRKYVSTDEDMDDGDATFTRKFTNGHRLADNSLGKRGSSSDDEEFKAIAKKVDDRYQVTFQDDDEDFENGHMLNKETKMKADKDFKFDIPSFSTETRVLHMDRRGVFTEDYFFANVRDSFSQAVREVLEKANAWTCRSDAMHNYRRLRQRNLKLETQAVGIIDDQDSHKIVMDVFDFIKGDVTVKLVKGKELLVEGQADKLDGSTVSQVSFERRLPLPDLVDRDAISCVLSSDGILTIISKKRACEYRTSARGFSSERKSYGDTAGRWEDKKVKDSLADLEGLSSRSFSTGSRSRYHRSYAKQY